MEDLKYPIGRYTASPHTTEVQRIDLIKSISELPEKLRLAVKGLSDSQLDNPYRDGGWTVRQVVHHIADSHMNSYLRFKFALTEDEPAIKGYKENVWSEFPDAKSDKIDMTLILLEALHYRLTLTLKNMSASDFERKLIHSEKGPLTLDYMLGLYAWHSKHHVAHITKLRDRKGWS